MYTNPDFEIQVDLTIVHDDQHIELTHTYQSSEFRQPMEPQQGDKIDVAAGNKITIVQRSTDNGVMVLEATLTIITPDHLDHETKEDVVREIVADFTAEKYVTNFH